MKKRILIHVHRVELLGGVEKVLYNLINNLDLNKYDITVLEYSRTTKSLEVYDNKIKLYNLYFDKLSNNKICRLYQRIYIKFSKHIIPIILNLKHYDLAIAFQEGIYAQFIEKIHAKKKLLWIHNDMCKGHWTGKYFCNSLEREKACYDEFDNIVCVSRDVLESMNLKFGKFNNLCVKYNPIDTNQILNMQDDYIEEHVSYKPLFIAVGRLCNQKGYDRLLEAIKRLNKENYILEVWILGEGEDREILEQFIIDNNINNVKLLGNKKNPYKYMKLADWIICTSRYEGFNTVLQEATFIGKPIVTTNNAGAEELLGKNEYGIIINNDKESIYKKLKDILENPRLEKEYKKKVLERKNFISIESRIRSIEELL